MSTIINQPVPEQAEPPKKKAWKKYITIKNTLYLVSAGAVIFLFFYFEILTKIAWWVDKDPGYSWTIVKLTVCGLLIVFLRKKAQKQKKQTPTEKTAKKPLEYVFNYTSLPAIGIYLIVLLLLWNMVFPALPSIGSALKVSLPFIVAGAVIVLLYFMFGNKKHIFLAGPLVLLIATGVFFQKSIRTYWSSRGSSQTAVKKKTVSDSMETATVVSDPGAGAQTTTPKAAEQPKQEVVETKTEVTQTTVTQPPPPQQPPVQSPVTTNTNEVDSLKNVIAKKDQRCDSLDLKLGTIEKKLDIVLAKTFGRQKGSKKSSGNPVASNTKEEIPPHDGFGKAVLAGVN